MFPFKLILDTVNFKSLVNLLNFFLYYTQSLTLDLPYSCPSLLGSLDSYKSRAYRCDKVSANMFSLPFMCSNQYMVLWHVFLVTSC